ncbi:MAG: UvrD-helicase domain-containing protein [Myxococcota bacterium]
MSEIPRPVEEESRLLETVLANLTRLEATPAAPDLDRRLTELRDSLEGEKLPEDIASIAEEMTRVAALRAQQQHSLQGHVDLDSPYFGHLVVDDDHGERSILIGKETFLSDRVRIVDWRNAPISRIFYQYAEGDDYEEEIAGRTVSGDVLVRRTVTITEGCLRRVGTHEETWVHAADGTWLDLRAHEARLAGGAGKAVRAGSLGTGHASGRRDKHLPDIASLLDPEQFDLITRPESGVVVIQGSAGSGKTTVGLHRIAYLAYRAPKRFRPQRVMVMVFSRALASYIEQVLPALGVEGVQVAEFGAWAEKLRRRHFKDLPNAYADETPASVVRFKTHAVMLRLVDEIGARRRGMDPKEAFDEVLTDRWLLGYAAERWAPGEFSERKLDQIHRWCSDAFFARSEDEGGEGPAALDREDDAILLRLFQVMVGPLRFRKNKALRYDHIMVDEAQDLGPIELAVLLETSGEQRSVTLAGDVAQKVQESRDFQDWTHVLDALDLSHVEVSPLEVSYRSTRQIMEVAHEILGPLAPDEPAATTREGAPAAHLAFTDMGAAVAWLAPALADVMQREPTAYIALLTVDLAQAVDWYQALDRAELPYLDLIDDQDFSFSPGIEITDIRSSKGLEFDYVVLLGVDGPNFPIQDGSRHLLHVGATRAAHQLWIVSTGRPSPLIPEGLPGLLEHQGGRDGPTTRR